MNTEKKIWQKLSQQTISISNYKWMNLERERIMTEKLKFSFWGEDSWLSNKQNLPPLTYYHFQKLMTMGSHRRCSIKDVILKKFPDIHRNTPLLEPLFNKLTLTVTATSLERDSKQVFSCGYCKIFKNTYCEEKCQTVASARSLCPFKDLSALHLIF